MSNQIEMIRIKTKGMPPEELEELISNGLYGIRYAKLHDDMLRKFGAVDENKYEGDFYKFSKNMDQKVIDDLMVYANRWKLYTRLMLKMAKSSSLEKFKPYYHMNEISGIFTNLHTVKGIRYGAVHVVIDFLDKLRKMNSIILKEVMETNNYPKDKFGSILNDVNETNDDKVMKIDGDLSKIGVSLGWVKRQQ